MLLNKYKIKLVYNINKINNTAIKHNKRIYSGDIQIIPRYCSLVALLLGFLVMHSSSVFKKKKQTATNTLVVSSLVAP